MAGSTGKSSKIEDEVVVRFPDVGTRDSVRSAAFNLAGSKAGMRLKIPDNLRPSLQALESVSFNLKKQHPTLKRNIKFDDVKKDLVMDVKLDEGGTWKKIRPEQALAAKSACPDESENEVDSDTLSTMLSGGGRTFASGANATGPDMDQS